VLDFTRGTRYRNGKWVLPDLLLALPRSPAMDLSRRDFNRLSMAALGGALAGATLGCGGSQPAPAPTAGTPADAPADADTGGDAAPTTQTAKEEVHACRGLNACKGQGAGGDNACAGQGACATTAAHDCAGKNACKGLGGCGEKPGANDCKGMGGCQVPMHAGAWEAARKTFEEKMAAAGKEVGAAPPRKEEG
jgi:hypothetical protein